MKEGRYESALDEYTAVAETYSDLNNRLDYARANRMVGEAYMQMREFDKAIQHQQIYLGIYLYCFIYVFVFYSNLI